MGNKSSKRESESSLKPSIKPLPPSSASPHPHGTQYIDLSVLNKESGLEDIDCNKDFKACLCISRVLTILRYYQLLNIHFNKNNCLIFNNLLNTIYKPCQLIMDFFHFKNIHNDEIKEIMGYALDNYQFPLCQIESCSFSSRLYRVNESIEIINIFDDDDKLNKLPVVVSLLDGIHHYIYHLDQCGLRDFGDKDDDNKDNDDSKQGDDYFDGNFCAMNKRILSKSQNTNRFKRLGNKIKFSINIDGGGGGNKYESVGGNLFSSDDIIDDGFQGTTYLDEIYINLEKQGISSDVINKLRNYAILQQFDTESMYLDLKIDDNDNNGGNIAVEINDDQCINLIKTMFNKSSGMILYF